MEKDVPDKLAVSSNMRGTSLRELLMGPGTARARITKVIARAAMRKRMAGCFALIMDQAEGIGICALALERVRATISRAEPPLFSGAPGPSPGGSGCGSNSGGRGSSSATGAALPPESRSATE